jgi:polyribonucleotide nucleotidyltransferase
MPEAIKVGHDSIRSHCKAQEELAAEVGKTKRTYCHEINDEAIRAQVHADLYPKCYDIAKQQIKDKQQRIDAFAAVVDEYVEAYKTANAENQEIDLERDEKLISQIFREGEKKQCAE